MNLIKETSCPESQPCDDCDCHYSLELDSDELRRLLRIGETWVQGLHYPGQNTREVAVALVETIKTAQ